MKSDIQQAQELGLKIGELIDGVNSDIAKLALMGIWELIHAMEIENHA